MLDFARRWTTDTNLPRALLTGELQAALVKLARKNRRPLARTSGDCAARSSTSSPTSPTGTTPPSANTWTPAARSRRPRTRLSGGAPGTRPLVVDPFAGGGSIPLEALRVGADAFASDLNPVPVLLNKVVLEYIPKYGQRLADEVRKWGEWIKREAEKELAEFYPKDADGATPIAYLWARTIQCEGPAAARKCRSSARSGLPRKPIAPWPCNSCRTRRPSAWTSKSSSKQRGGWVDQDEAQDNKIDRPEIRRHGETRLGDCPCCGYTTPVRVFANNLEPRRGGANDARLCAWSQRRVGEQGRFYRLPTEADSRRLSRRLRSELQIGKRTRT